MPEEPHYSELKYLLEKEIALLLKEINKQIHYPGQLKKESVSSMPSERYWRSSCWNNENITAKIEDLDNSFYQSHRFCGMNIVVEIQSLYETFITNVGQHWDAAATE